MINLVAYARSPIGWLAGGVTLLLSAWGWLAWHDHKVVKQERVRVEKIGQKLNAKAQDAASRARTQPDSVLSKFYRD